MARHESFARQAGKTRKAMEDAIMSAAGGATINVANEKDAQFYKDLAQFDFGRGDIKFQSPGMAAKVAANQALIEGAKKDLADAIMGRTAKDMDKQLRDMVMGSATTTSNIADAPPAPKPSPMMIAIAQAPRDGTEIMVWCPDQTPAHVAAVYRSAKQGGETIWEGWCYADAVLADMCPEGPQNPTHYYLPPTVETQVAKAYHDGGVLNFDKLRSMRALMDQGETVVPRKQFQDEYQSSFENDRFTPAQMAELKRRDISPKHVDTRIFNWVESSFDRIMAVDPRKVTNIMDKAEQKSAICPIIDRNMMSDTVTIVLPDGKIQNMNY